MKKWKTGYTECFDSKNTFLFHRNTRDCSVKPGWTVGAPIERQLTSWVFDCYRRRETGASDSEKPDAEEPNAVLADFAEQLRVVTQT